MRWDGLFADLEAQLDYELSLEEQGVAFEAERLRRARLTMGERLWELSGGHHRIRVLLVDGGSLEVRVDTAGADWIAGEGSRGESVRDVIVPIASVVAALPEPSAEDRRPSPGRTPDALTQRLGIAFVLRDLSRRRIVVELRTVSGIHHGTVGRVGADHLDLREAEPLPARGSRIVPFSSLVAVWI